jgi:glycine hydroxymethyltransferase
LNGLRIGTPELVRWGVTEAHTKQLAGLIARALNTNDEAPLAGEVAEMRRQFQTIHFLHGEK